MNDEKLVISRSAVEAWEGFWKWKIQCLHSEGCQRVVWWCRQTPGKRELSDGTCAFDISLSLEIYLYSKNLVLNQTCLLLTWSFMLLLLTACWLTYPSQPGWSRTWRYLSSYLLKTTLVPAVCLYLLVRCWIVLNHRCWVFCYAYGALPFTWFILHFSLICYSIVQIWGMAHRYFSCMVYIIIYFSLFINYMFRILKHWNIPSNLNDYWLYAGFKWSLYLFQLQYFSFSDQGCQQLAVL